MTIKAPATLPADVTCTLGNLDFGSCALLANMMTTDTAQSVTATKSFKEDQGFYDYVKFYAGNNASSFSWMEGAATTTQLAWYDSSSSKRMYLDVNGTAWFLAAPSVVAQTTDAASPSLVVEGKAGQVADIFEVRSDYGGTLYLWLGGLGNVGISTDLFMTNGNIHFAQGGTTSYRMKAPDTTTLAWYDSSGLLAMDLYASSLRLTNRSFYATNSTDSSVYAELHAASSVSQLILHTGIGANERSIGVATVSGGAPYFWVMATPGATYTGVTATGCSSFIGGICVASGASNMMTTDTAQDVTATKSFKADQGFYNYLKFYAGNNASSFSWMEGAAPPPSWRGTTPRRASGCIWT